MVFVRLSLCIWMLLYVGTKSLTTRVNTSIGSGAHGGTTVMYKNAHGHDRSSLTVWHKTTALTGKLDLRSCCNYDRAEFGRTKLPRIPALYRNRSYCILSRDLSDASDLVQYAPSEVHMPDWDELQGWLKSKCTQLHFKYQLSASR